MTNEELTFDDKWDLREFWGFCESVETEMKKNTSHPDKDLPLSNRMICYTFAAATWERHKKDVEELNRKEEIEECFHNEHGKEIVFVPWFNSSVKPSRLLWNAEHDAILSSPFDDQEKFLAATESDFIKLPKIGKKKLERLIELQKEIAAHREFFAKHPDYLHKEEK